MEADDVAAEDAVVGAVGCAVEGAAEDAAEEAVVGAVDGAVELTGAAVLAGARAARRRFGGGIGAGAGASGAAPERHRRFGSGGDRPRSPVARASAAAPLPLLGKHADEAEGAAVAGDSAGAEVAVMADGAVEADCVRRAGARVRTVAAALSGTTKGAASGWNLET